MFYVLLTTIYLNSNFSIIVILMFAIMVKIHNWINLIYKESNWNFQTIKDQIKVDIFIIDNKSIYLAYILIYTQFNLKK